jgi:hypothetical protein
MRLDDDAWALWRADHHFSPLQSPAWANAWWDHLGGAESFNGVDFSIPGTLTFACLIEAAIAEGAREFHILRGEEEYEYKWGATPMRTVRRTLRRS